MMNVIAMWVLFSSTGAGLVMSLEPLLPEQNHLEAAMEATEQSLHHAAEAARLTNEAILRSLQSASQLPGKTAHTVQSKAGEAAQAVKDSSQLGLEKIGLAQPIESSSHFELWESGLQASKDRVATLKHAAAESAENTRQGVQDIFSEHFGKEEVKPPTRYEVIKEKVANVFDAHKHATGETVEAAKDQAGQAAKAAQHKVTRTGDWIQDGARATSKSAEDAASEVQEKARNAAGFGQEKASESSEFIRDLASRIAESVQENIDSAGGEASETAESVYEDAADGLKGTVSRTRNLVANDRSPPTYRERTLQATEQAADIMKSRGKEAVSHLPNVGQGLAYGSPDTQEKSSVSDYVHKAEEWIGVGQNKESEHGFKRTVGEYVEEVKKKLSGGDRPAKPSNWREEFLNKVGIYSEEDLSKRDIVVGNINGYFSGSAFQESGEAVRSAATATQDAVHTGRDKAAESMSNAGEAIRHMKDDGVDGVKDAAEAIVDNMHHDIRDETNTPQFYDTDDTLTQSGADEGYSLKNRTANELKKVGWIATAWLSSCLRTAHLFTFSSVYGTSLWVTFVSGYLLSRSIPRHQFGFVQSQIFPTYLSLVACGQAVCFSLYVILHPWSNADGTEKLQYLDLLGTLMASLANAFFWEPRATKMMFEKMKLEKEEGRGQNGLTGAEEGENRARLAKIDNALHVSHGYSSLANLLSLLGMTWHLWHLSRRLVI